MMPTGLQEGTFWWHNNPVALIQHRIHGGGFHHCHNLPLGLRRATYARACRKHTTGRSSVGENPVSTLHLNHIINAVLASVDWRLACASVPAELMPDGALTARWASTFICLREGEQADAVWHICATRLCHTPAQHNQQC